MDCFSIAAIFSSMRQTIPTMTKTAALLCLLYSQVLSHVASAQQQLDPTVELHDVVVSKPLEFGFVSRDVLNRDHASRVLESSSIVENEKSRDKMFVNLITTNDAHLMEENARDQHFQQVIEENPQIGSSYENWMAQSSSSLVTDTIDLKAAHLEPSTLGMDADDLENSPETTLPNAVQEGYENGTDFEPGPEEPSNIMDHKQSNGESKKTSQKSKSDGKKSDKGKKKKKVVDDKQVGEDHNEVDMASFKANKSAKESKTMSSTKVPKGASTISSKSPGIAMDSSTTITIPNHSPKQTKSPKYDVDASTKGPKDQQALKTPTPSDFQSVEPSPASQLDIDDNKDGKNADTSASLVSGVRTLSVAAFEYETDLSIEVANEDYEQVLEVTQIAFQELFDEFFGLKNTMAYQETEVKLDNVFGTNIISFSVTLYFDARRGTTPTVEQVESVAREAFAEDGESNKRYLDLLNRSNSKAFQTTKSVRYIDDTDVLKDVTESSDKGGDTSRKLPLIGSLAAFFVVITAFCFGRQARKSSKISEENYAVNENRFEKIYRDSYDIESATVGSTHMSEYRTSVFSEEGIERDQDSVDELYTRSNYLDYGVGEFPKDIYDLEEVSIESSSQSKSSRHDVSQMNGCEDTLLGNNSVISDEEDRSYEKPTDSDQPQSSINQSSNTFIIDDESDASDVTSEGSHSAQEESEKPFEYNNDIIEEKAASTTTTLNYEENQESASNKPEWMLKKLRPVSERKPKTENVASLAKKFDKPPNEIKIIEKPIYSYKFKTPKKVDSASEKQEWSQVSLRPTGILSSKIKSSASEKTESIETYQRRLQRTLNASQLAKSENVESGTLSSFSVTDSKSSPLPAFGSNPSFDSVIKELKMLSSGRQKTRSEDVPQESDHETLSKPDALAAFSNCYGRASEVNRLAMSTEATNPKGKPSMEEKIVSELSVAEKAKLFNKVLFPNTQKVRVLLEETDSTGIAEVSGKQIVNDSSFIKTKEFLDDKFNKDEVSVSKPSASDVIKLASVQMSDFPPNRKEEISHIEENTVASKLSVAEKAKLFNKILFPKKQEEIAVKKEGVPDFVESSLGKTSTVAMKEENNLIMPKEGEACFSFSSIFDSKSAFMAPIENLPEKDRISCQVVQVNETKPDDSSSKTEVFVPCPSVASAFLINEEAALNKETQQARFSRFLITQQENNDVRSTTDDLCSRQSRELTVYSKDSMGSSATDSNDDKQDSSCNKRHDQVNHEELSYEAKVDSPILSQASYVRTDILESDGDSQIRLKPQDCIQHCRFPINDTVEVQNDEIAILAVDPAGQVDLNLQDNQKLARINSTERLVEKVKDTKDFVSLVMKQSPEPTDTNDKQPVWMRKIPPSIAAQAPKKVDVSVSRKNDDSKPGWLKKVPQALAAQTPTSTDVPRCKTHANDDSKPAWMKKSPIALPKGTTTSNPDEPKSSEESATSVPEWMRKFKASRIEKGI